MHKIRNLKLGAEVRLTTGNHTLAGVTGGLMKLRNVDTGEYSVVPISEMPLMLEEPLEPLTVEPRDLDRVSVQERSDAEVLASHIQEVLSGRRADGSGNEPRPEYDPSLTSLNQRMAAKTAELKSLGKGLSVRTLRRRIADFREFGTAGLVDQRQLRKPKPLARADDRVVEALRAVIARERNASTGSVERVTENLREELLKRFPGEGVIVPPPTTLWRYISLLTKGQYTFGNAANRRSKANAPDRMFDSRPAIMPGHEVQIDSSPFDIMVLNGAGKPKRAVLTIMVDKATRSIIATSVVMKASKGVDHALLLAKAVVPRPLRPGGEHFTKYELPVMPWAKVLDPEEAAKYETAQPFIVPQRIMTDNGSDYVSIVFRAACEQLGFSLTESSTYTPTDKAIVERTFGSIKTMFAQHLPGFSGGTVTNRGTDPAADEGLLDIYTLSELFDRWVTIVWQNRPHEGLRDPVEPSIVHTPNSMYMAMFELTGYVPIPLTADDYISLMPVKYITIQADGITLDYRRYDSMLLHPYRLLKSSDAAHNGKWAVHYDPYNPGAVWVMDPFTELWIECSWMNGDAFAKPFSRHIRTEAKRILEDMGMTGDSSMLRLTQDVLASTKAARTQMDDEAERNKVAAQRNELSGMPSPVLTSPAETGDDTEFEIYGTAATPADERDFDIYGATGSEAVSS